MTYLKIPKITSTEQTLITDDSLETFNNILQHFELQKFNDSWDLKQKIEFLIDVTKHTILKNKLESEVFDLCEKIEEHEINKNLENENDILEVKLERLKYKYQKLIDSNINLQELMAENKRLEFICKKYSANEINVMKSFVKNIDNSVDSHILQKFGALLNNKKAIERMEEKNAFKKIMSMPKNTFNTFCINLLKYKKISLTKYCDTMRVEKKELLKIVYDMVNNNLATFDGTDIVKIIVK